jgi:cytochrome c oxidase accessory protein FixG
MFDKDTYIVGYNPSRGEKRGPRSRKADPSKLGLGDCIDCDLCVQVCPTGIDIRDGLQYECINCGACIDICNQTMDRMGYEKNLISYTTEHRLSGKHTKIMRPKLIGYGSVMLLMLSLFVLQIVSVEPVGMSVLRDRNQLFKVDNKGIVENTYTLKVINKTQQDQSYHLTVEGLDGSTWFGAQTIQVTPGEVLNLPISLAIDSKKLHSPVSTIQFILTDSNQFRIEVESRFVKNL